MNKILIANRSEIAVRIIRACKEMNIKTVAVYSQADKDAIHTRFADEAICIGPGDSSKSYLNMKNILEAANITKADSIHPGFGFLSENSLFAKICEESNIKFIGPSSKVIELLGKKDNAKALAKSLGIPVLPGSDKCITDEKEALEIAKAIGYPVIIKAASGGGGKGIRIVYHEDELLNNFNLAKNESKASFNNDEVYIEKYLENPRHVEIQFIADDYGNVIHLGERDCSVQRNNQKIIEETPCAILSDELRNKMGSDAVRLAKAVSYSSCGTVEFLLDKNNNYYFMEVNTRIQVEHPITEMRTGIDLVKKQIKLAAGEKLDMRQDDVSFNGHAIECRINAENPYQNFRPSPGKITGLYIPGGNGIRVDTAIYDGYVVPPYYDSNLMKIIAYGKTRNEALAKMRRALEELIIEGVDTNQDFLLDIICNPDYIKGDFDTSFIKNNFNI